MSDHIVKIIPADPYLCITEQQSQKAVQFIKQNIRADFVKVHIQESPVFVDCGQNLKSISCPHCAELLDFGWWGTVMSKAAENNNACYPCAFISLCMRPELSALNSDNYINPSG